MFKTYLTSAALSLAQNIATLASLLKNIRQRGSVGTCYLLNGPMKWEAWAMPFPQPKVIQTLMSQFPQEFPNCQPVGKARGIPII